MGEKISRYQQSLECDCMGLVAAGAEKKDTVKMSPNLQY